LGNLALGRGSGPVKWPRAVPRVKARPPLAPPAGFAYADAPSGRTGCERFPEACLPCPDVVPAWWRRADPGRDGSCAVPAERNRVPRFCQTRRAPTIPHGEGIPVIPARGLSGLAYSSTSGKTW